MSASRLWAAIVALVFLSVGCASRPDPEISPAKLRDESAPVPRGTYRLELVDGQSLPVHVRVPRDSMRGVATPPGMEVVAGALWFLNDGGAHLALRMRLLDCGPAATSPDLTAIADCRSTPQEPTVGGAVPFTYKPGRITVTWRAGGRSEVAEGTVRGDTIALDLPFRRVYGPGRAEARWTQRFIFVRRSQID